MVKTIEFVNTKKVSCNNNEEHPLVYYTLKQYKDGIKTVCFYCGKMFIYKENVIK
jgi:hypothetical protein